MKRPRSLRKRLALIVLCLIAAWPVTAWLAAKALIVKTDIAGADAIIILSGSGTYVERADWAAKLYREQRAQLVVLSNEDLLSGWSARDERNLFFYELSARRLEQKGVAPANIRVVSDIGSGTYKESARICDYAAEQGLNRILIVTSAYHSRRALWSITHACQNKPLQIGIDTPPPGWQTPPARSWWLHRNGWRFVAGEYVKMVYYRLAY